VGTYRQVKGSQPLLRAAAITPSGNPAYWHQGGGWAFLGFRVSFRFRLVGMGGVAAGDHEGKPRPHWPRTLLRNTFQSLAVGLGCVVLIFMADQRLT
jgi:hypothetical protein